MSRLFITDKRSGITYVYENHPYWDKEKKQSRSHRTIIGKLDKETGEIVRTDGRCYHLTEKGRKEAAAKKKQQQEAKEKEKAASQKETARSMTRTFCGATWLLDGIAQRIGLTQDLKTCFPSDYKKILSIAYFLILSDSNALSHFDSWAALHEHPAGAAIPSQRSSELFQRITEDDKMQFFRLQAKRRADEEFWAGDSTSISSYSEQLRQVKYGRNKDHEPLPQLNLLILFGEGSNLPFYYRKLSGNIPDVKTVRALVEELRPMGVKGAKLLMDRGFYSEANVNALYNGHHKFLLGCSTSLSFVKERIEANKDSMQYPENYDTQHNVYCHSESFDWMCPRHNTRSGEPEVDAKRAYLHLYYNDMRAAEDKTRKMAEASLLKEAIESGAVDETNRSRCECYFNITKRKGRVYATSKHDVLDEVRSRYGFFALLSNEVEDARRALDLYRNRDVVEKAFRNWKERLNCNRLLVSSEQALEGKLFVHFVALILLSYIKKQMRKKELYEKYTTETLLMELDSIELIKMPGHRPFVREVLAPQIKIFDAMEINPPIVR